MDAFEARKKELLTPIYLEAGCALGDCQFFEYSIVYFLFLLSKLGVSGLDTQRFMAILDDEEKKTAGQLIVLLKKHLTVSDGIQAGLEAALLARNRLVHRYFIDNTERLLEVGEHEAIVKEIRSLRSTVRNGRDLLDPFVNHLAKRVDGLDTNQISEEAKAQFMRGATRY